MRVAVTGSGGRIGREVAIRLRDEGMEVIGIDKREDNQIEGVRSFKVNLCDLGQLYGTFTRCGMVDAIVHLGAFPSPWDRPAEVVFTNNVIGQFNIFEAAATLGIRRVVNISSVSALGFPFQHRWSEPLYVPIDEEHPLIPQDAYGLSKACGELIAEAYCRRSGGSAASLRISMVVDKAGCEKLARTECEETAERAQSLWSYIDMRDVTEACLLALTADFEGHQPLYIIAEDTMSHLETETLLDDWFPTVERRSLNGRYQKRWSLLDGSRAAEVIGFRPRHCWMEVLDDEPRRAEGERS